MSLLHASSRLSAWHGVLGLYYDLGEHSLGRSQHSDLLESQSVDDNHLMEVRAHLTGAKAGLALARGDC
ncbi:MAG: hypothetical protein AAFY30_14070 [Cyanobacteria bacterium J06642_12]